MIVAMIFAMLLVLMTVLIHYECLRMISISVPRLVMPPRLRIVLVVIGVFFAHTVEVWCYAIAYYLLADRLGIGTFGGEFHFGFADYLYFSTVSYTSLGLGDVYPLGGMRLITGVEALNGLVLIGWSASFTYLMMQEFWNLHRAKL